MEKYLKLDTNISPIYARSISEFNTYVSIHKTNNKIILTRGNNISQNTLRCLPASLTWQRGNHMEFHYIDGKQHIRVIYALHYDAEAELSTTIAYDSLKYFAGLMDLIPTDDVEEDTTLFTCPENKYAKYYNYCNDRYTNFTISNCYSLDRNSSFMASLVKVYPQAKKYADQFQADKIRIKVIPKELRTQKQNELLQYDKIFIGWLKNPRYHREHAWKKIISDSNRVIHDLRKKIEANGNTVLVVNTDAVKFIGKYDYLESKELGEFKYEWQNTNMYIKSVKSYAYVDNGKWKFKQAGKCKLDQLKSREEWTLDDFKSKDTIKVAHIIINKQGELIEIYE